MANNDATQEPRQLPRHARLFGYAVDAEELLILLAIDDHMYRGKGPGDPDGTTFKASVQTLCVWTKLSKKTIQRRLRGYSPKEGVSEEDTERYRQAWRKGDRKVPYKPGFIDRKILKVISEGSPEDNTPTTYEFVEVALKEDPRWKSIQERRSQPVLPGFREPRAPGHPVYPEREYSPILYPSVSVTPGQKPDIRPGVSLTLPPPVSPHPPGVRATHPGVSLSPGPSVSLTHPSVSLTPDPATGLDLVSTKDSSVLKDSSKTTTSSDVPVELKNGLREILPALDDRAVKQLWSACRDHAPDCTVEEILYFAWEKFPALKRQSTHNPAGLLIHAVPLCFEGGERSALYHLREERIREQGRRARAEEEQAAEDKANQEWLREMEAVEREAAQLDSLPAEEFEALHAEAERADWVAQCRRQMPSDQLEKMIRREMAKRRIAARKQEDEPPP